MSYRNSYRNSEENIRSNLRNIEQSLEEAEAHLKFSTNISQQYIGAGYDDEIIIKSLKDVDECQRKVDYWELEVEEFTSKCAEYLI